MARSHYPIESIALQSPKARTPGKEVPGLRSDQAARKNKVFFSYRSQKIFFPTKKKNGY
jgi:hypothetical protein